jgi:regulatory protein
MNTMDNAYLISALEPQKKKKDRYNVYIDGEYSCSLSADSCVVFDIKTGRQIAEDELKRAVMSDNTQFAFDSAISLLSFKMRTRAELTEKLIGRKIDEKAIEAALKKLDKYGYVNDVEYANEYVQSAIRAGRYGRTVIAYKLKKKGIDEHTLEDAMRALTGELEKQAAKKQLMSLYKKYQNVDAYKKRTKIFATLARRGFDYDIINTILAEIEAD